MPIDNNANVLTRRDLLQKGGKLAISLGSGFALDSVLSGCSAIDLKETATLRETAPVVYPPLRGFKIQPPSNGCMIGFRYRSFQTKTIIRSYGEKTGQIPSIFILHWTYKMSSSFPVSSAAGAISEGVTPFIFFKIIWDLNEIINKKYDQEIEVFAREATKFGEKYGGFIINTMWEMNINGKNAHPWCSQPELFQKTWIHIWQIFEDSGANEYATWMIEYHVDFPLEGYYPGDLFVDWIGFSAYNRAILQRSRGYRYLDDLISKPYDYFRTRYANKPIMQAEFGTTTDHNQPKWLLKAFQTIKSKQGIKAAIYWDNVATELGDDHTLTEESFKTLKDIFKDPYWIMAKK
jgi:hypothetical protein